ncbi:MAG: deoxyribodipyrimidine photolyase [Planctomycetaceae bacterium]
MSGPLEPSSEVAEIRIRRCNHRAARGDADYVLYWMTAYRRLSANYALQRAIDWCEHLGKPLLIFEPIGCRARWNNDRIHAFVLGGMRDQQAECVAQQLAYVPYVEPVPGTGAEVIRRLCAQAAVVVTDDFPCHIIPRMIEALSGQVEVLVEAIDGNGIWPMRGTEQVFPSAYAFRRFLQSHLKFEEWPQENPFAKRKLPRLADERLERSRTKFAAPANDKLLTGSPAALAELPIDHAVAPAEFSGGAKAANQTLSRFLDQRLDRYAEQRNDVDDEAASGLSPYLHFGQIGVHQIVRALMQREAWTPEMLGESRRGAKAGWWGMSPGSEAFLDELVTWRELGFNFCSHRADYDQYSSLPDWAKKTLEKHQTDARPVKYVAERLEAAETHDELWNAAQRQLVRDGRMHNYLRMLWGKKVLEWSDSPEEAVEILIDLNNKYAVDGRDPNSYSGIFWVFGRYDRPWGPERPIFGTIRYMSSQNTARKLSVKEYLRRYGPAKRGLLDFDSA